MKRLIALLVRRDTDSGRAVTTPRDEGDALFSLPADPLYGPFRGPHPCGRYDQPWCPVCYPTVKGRR